MTNKNKTLKKGAFFTDIHFGKKANSTLHNEDCIRFIEWFCENVKADPEIDYIGFLGDWNENRSALNIATLNYSYQGAKLINELGLPVYFVVGNHDLYNRNNREIHSIVPFEEFSNFVVIDEPVLEENIEGGVLFSPYLFHADGEYDDLIKKYRKVPFWAGHFEFKGFLVTGYGIKMPTGPSPEDFLGPKHIVSGHFHKRQADGNIVYMGNTFPMDFGDAGDDARGMMTHDHIKDEMLFSDWAECPKYLKVKLSDLLNETETVYPDSRVKCIVDVPITFEESTAVREAYMKMFNLREFSMEESLEIKEAMTDTETTIDWDEHELASVNELVLQMLTDIESEHIDNDKLVDIYKGLKTHI